MGSSYKASKKELLEIRNKIFVENGIPELIKNGYEESPFSTSWFGKDDLGGYTYELCKLSNGSQFEIIKAIIVRGDRWIQIYLNIFKLIPEPTSIKQLKGVDGLKYHLKPNSLTEMRLRIDDIKGIPLFNYHFMFGGHKLKSFSSEAGLNRRAKTLRDLIEKDAKNINSFVNRWHELHVPNTTNWEGKNID